MAGESEVQEPALPYHLVLRERVEAKARRVREVWVEWAIEQPAPKPSWLVPYDELSEADKEADRRIGTTLWGDGFFAGFNAGLEAAVQMVKRAETTVHDR